MSAEPLVNTFRAEIERLSNQRIHPRAFDLEPLGNRLLVVLDPAPATYKGIVIPEGVRKTENMGGGWVIAVGPDVGMVAVPYPGGPKLNEPNDLLGCHVIFGSYVGKTIRFQFLDRSLGGTVVLMTDRDLWAIDSNVEEAARELRE